MNINLKLDINNLERYYPYIGIFSNNPNDIRGLQFLYYYSNNKESEYSSVISDKKYLKYEYYNLFKDAFQHLLNLKNYLIDEDKFNDYYLRKWYFDFIYSGIKSDDNDLFNFPSIYPEKEIYNDIFPRNEIINRLSDKDLIPDVLDFDFLDIDNELIPIMVTLITIYEDRLKNYLSYFDGYINNINNKIDESPINSLFPTLPASLDKSFIFKNIGNFDSNIVKNINELLDFKYLRFAELKQKKREIKWHRFEPIQTDHCFKTYLNIENNECNKLLKNILFKEKDYGQISKNFFRNKEYFKIFDNAHKQNIFFYSSYINQLILEKLKFKKKEIKFFNNSNIYDFFVDKKFIKLINLENNKFEIELPNKIVNNLKENDKLILLYYTKNFYIPCKIIKIINTNTITVILNNKVLNELIYRTSSSNYKNEDYILDKTFEPKSKKFKNTLSKSEFEDIISSYTPDYIGFNKILIPKGEIYLKYYESINSWKNNQTIDKKLNENKNLLEFLEYCIEVINRKIIYLNPEFKMLYESKEFISSLIVENIIAKNIELNNNKIKLKSLLKLKKPIEYEKSYTEISNKISNLLNDKEIDNDRVLDVIRSNLNLDSNYLQHLTEFNFLNKVQILNSYFSNPNKKNLNILLSILNLLSKFNNNLIKFNI